MQFMLGQKTILCYYGYFEAVRPSLNPPLTRLLLHSTNLLQLEDFIRKKKNILHPNHSLMTVVELISGSSRGVDGEAEPGGGSVNLITICINAVTKF